MLKTPCPRLQDIPVYILASNKTFSGAEEFAYNFKHLKRATLNGEKTKGGANPWQWFEVGASHRVAIRHRRQLTQSRRQIGKA